MILNGCNNPDCNCEGGYAHSSDKTIIDLLGKTELSFKCPHCGARNEIKQTLGNHEWIPTDIKVYSPEGSLIESFETPDCFVPSEFPPTANWKVIK